MLEVLACLYLLPPRFQQMFQEHHLEESRYQIQHSSSHGGWTYIKHWSYFQEPLNLKKNNGRIFFFKLFLHWRNRVLRDSAIYSTLPLSVSKGLTSLPQLPMQPASEDVGSFQPHLWAGLWSWGHPAACGALIESSRAATHPMWLKPGPVPLLLSCYC